MESHVPLEHCDSGGSSGGIVGGGKRTKTQSRPKSVTSRSRGRQQSAGMIDKQKFYGRDQLTRPPLPSHCQRRSRPRSHQICKLVFLCSASVISFLLLSVICYLCLKRNRLFFLSFCVSLCLLNL